MNVNLAHQIRALIREGLSPEQISEATGYSLESVILACSATSARMMSVEELIETYRPEMIQVLYNIAVDESKNESARVKAASIIVEGKGVLPELSIDSLDEQFRKMKTIVEQSRNAHHQQIIDVPSSSPSIKNKKEEELISI